jgi:hypothetical protein
MEVNDVVRVTTQPTNQICRLVGTVGFVEEIQGNYISLYALNLDGSTSGCGSLPADCVTIIQEPEWIAAKEKYDQAFKKRQEEFEKQTKRFRKGLKKIAAKYGITPKVAKKIHSEISRILL